MSQSSTDQSVPNTMDANISQIFALQEENLNLKRQIKILEGEKENISAFLEQKIELLEAQIESFKEREENTKRTNQTIMRTLEEMNEKGSQNGLKIKAIEELEKASQQYNQALLDLKTRMKEETSKLEMENKKLIENAIEKEYEIKALKSFIKEIRNEYTGVKAIDSTTKRATIAQDEKEYIRDRIQTLPNYLTEKEVTTREGLDARRDTLRYPFDEEGNMESLRFQSQFFDQNSTLCKDEDFTNNLKGTSHRHKIEYYWKELAKRKSRVENKDKLEELYMHNSVLQGLSPTQKLLLRESQPLQSQKAPLSSLAGESSTACLSEPRLQKNTMFSASTLSLASDFTKQENYTIPWEASAPLGIPKKEISIKDQLMSAAFLDFKRKSIEQAFCQPRNTEGFRGGQDLSISTYDIQDKSAFKNVPKGNKSKKSNKYKRQSQTCFENIEDILKESKNTNRERENVDQYVKEICDYQDEMMTPQKTNNKDEEENIGAKSEIKFMIGRLLKVKNKLEKQSSVLNVSRSAQGWDQPLPSFSTAGTIKESFLDKGQVKNIMEYNEKTSRLAMTERKQNVLGGKHDDKNTLGGRRESVQPRKLVR